MLTAVLQLLDVQSGGGREFLDLLPNLAHLPVEAGRLLNLRNKPVRLLRSAM